jgi:hypothetical protein
VEREGEAAMTMAGRNRIKNSSFEDAFAAGQWQNANAVTAPDAIERTTDYAYQGDYSLRFTDTGAGADLAIDTDYAIPVRAGDVWVASAYCLGVTGDMSISFILEYNDGSSVARHIADVPSAFWGRRYAAFEIPDGVMSITTFRVQKGDVAPGTSPGVAAVDCVQLEEGWLPTAYYRTASERTAGEMVIEDYQYEYNGFLFGHNTDVLVEEINGLLGMPSSSSGDISFAGDHGAIPGVVRMDKRTVEIALHLLGSAGTDIEDKLAWAAACFRVPRLRSFGASRELKPFVFQRPGQPKKMCLVRCDRREFSSNYDTAVGKASGSVQLVAPDPVIFSYEEHSTSVTLPAAALSGTMTVTNAGDHPDGVRPVVRITGPARNPRIKNDADDDRTLRLDLDIDATQALTIDLYTRVVHLEDASDPAIYVDKFDAVRSDNEWWNLLPDDNLITYTRDGSGLSGASSTLTVVHRDGWS